MAVKRGLIFMMLAGLLVLFSIDRYPQVVKAEPSVFVSSVQAGCYRAKMDRCKIKVEPFTINLASGTKLAFFQLLATRTGTGQQKLIYDFKPDLSNPVPFTGTTFTPSRIAKDFAATCGESYFVTLVGKDTGDSLPFNLGATGVFTCPKGDYRVFLPRISH